MNEQVTHYSNGIESPLKCFKIKIRFIVMHIYIHTQNYSSAFNPSRLALVEHANAQGHTLIETGAIHWRGGQPITTPGEHGSTVPCLLTVSVSPIFEW